MGLRINDTVPDFTARTNQGDITSFHEWLGDGWGILFSHPKAFTPVCTTELSAAAQMTDEWAKRNTKILAVSVGGVDDQNRWIGDIETFGGSSVGYPIIADHDLTISKAFDMLPAEAYLPEKPTPADTQTVRSVFIIGPDKKLKLSMTYPMTIGRNFAEVLRALDALQASTRLNLAMPVNWEVGQDVIVPVAVSTDDAKAKYGAVEEIFPYLRRVKFPA